MNELHSEQNHGFLWLVGYRALLAGVGVYVVAEKPFGGAIFDLFVLGALLLVGEGFYKSKLVYDRECLRLQKEREMKEARAEEARLRLEEFKSLQEESAGKYMTFENEVQPVAIVESTQAGQSAASTADGNKAGNE